MIRPQPCRLHARQVMARQAHPAHEVDLDHPLPLVVADLLERARLEDAEIVDQDRDLGEALAAPAPRPERCRGRRPAAPAAPRVGRGDGGHRLGHARLGAAVDDHPGALGGQRLGDGEADAGGGAGDERQLAGELQIHGVPPFRRARSRRHPGHQLAAFHLDDLAGDIGAEGGRGEIGEGAGAVLAGAQALRPDLLARSFQLLERQIARDRSPPPPPPIGPDCRLCAPVLPSACATASAAIGRCRHDLAPLRRRHRRVRRSLRGLPARSVGRDPRRAQGAARGGGGDRRAQATQQAAGGAVQLRPTGRP